MFSFLSKKHRDDENHIWVLRIEWVLCFKVTDRWLLTIDYRFSERIHIVDRFWGYKY